MSDKPRDWPNLAKEARDRAAELATTGIKTLQPLVMEDRNFTETERSNRESRALHLFTEIARHLEKVGAPTRPE
jgi:hypothetical protein